MIALGTAMATGTVKPGQEWFEAFALDEDDARDQQAWFEAEQLEQETIAKYTRAR